VLKSASARGEMIDANFMVSNFLLVCISPLLLGKR
jgi:hypothetical protein